MGYCVQQYQLIPRTRYQFAGDVLGVLAMLPRADAATNCATIYPVDRVHGAVQ